MFDQVNITNWIETMLVLIVAITIHEFAHALATDRCGDPTPRSQGRLSLNPIDHLDPMGTVLMAISTFTGFGIGWGRPVQYNPFNLKHPRWDKLKIAMWGPISNVLQALVFAGLIRLDVQTNWLGGNEAAWHLLNMAVYVNLALAFFNMIPIPPLDGSKIFSSILPLAGAQQYHRVMTQWGLLLFMALVFTRATSYVIGPPTAYVYRLLVG